MSIEFPYNYWANSYIPYNVVMTMAWAIPAIFALNAIKGSRVLTNITLALIFATLILGSERYFINQRFISLSESGSEIKLLFLHGKETSINPAEIEKFWSVKRGRGGRGGCYLYIKMKNGQEYRSMGMENYLVCSSPAKELNKRYVTR